MIVTVLIILVLVLAGSVAVSVWQFTRVLEREGLRAAPNAEELDVEIMAVGPDWIELRPCAKGSADWAREGRYRLLWEGGAAPVGGIRALDASSVRRSFEAPASGKPGRGTKARLDPFAFGDDPQQAHGISFEEVPVPGQLGEMPAWLVPGDPSRWAIMVHGKGAGRGEALRALPLIHAAGATTLVITYRNDGGAPAGPDGRYAYGASEWEDLEAAVSFARAQGAERFLLVGYSMGGAVCLSFMGRSPAAADVDAIVLDAPAYSFDTCVAHAVGRKGMPPFLSYLLTKASAAVLRAPLGEMDVRRFLPALSIPVLLFHGSQDERTPVAESDAFAAARPDIVVYERYEGVAHVRSWNVHPSRYEAALSRFVEGWRRS